jgi:hypothetical protein
MQRNLTAVEADFARRRAPAVADTAAAAARCAPLRSCPPPLLIETHYPQRRNPLPPPHTLHAGRAEANPYLIAAAPAMLAADRADDLVVLDERDAAARGDDIVDLAQAAVELATAKGNTIIIETLTRGCFRSSGYFRVTTLI